MDKASIESVLDRHPEIHARLVLGLASPPGDAGDIGRESFGSRTEYRKALIERQRKVRGGIVTGFAKELRDSGLDAVAYQLTNTIVVEGIASKLIDALRDKRVWTADFDDELTLIEPIK